MSKKVIITIDTEGHEGIDPVKRLVWGKAVDGKEYGINYIMDICDRYSAKALFFVDIAEAWDYGKEKIEDVIRHIRNRGHDVGVHIHPDHMADKKRLFLWQYTKEEQYEIINRCTKLYTEITGEPPVAFRAGKYGANIDTLDILDELGYKYDFSQFYGQKWCGITPPVAITLPQKYKGLIEIPVTIFRSFTLGKFKRYDKVDAVMYGPEYKSIMNQIAADKRDILVVLFYHSFSMLNWRHNPDKPSVNHKEEQKFINVLKYVHESEKFNFVSLCDLDNSLNNSKDRYAEDTVNNIISTQGLVKSSWFTLMRAYSIKSFNRKARLLLYGILLLVFAPVILIIYSIF